MGGLQQPKIVESCALRFRRKYQRRRRTGESAEKIDYDPGHLSDA
jgi:hypothetical protein